MNAYDWPGNIRQLEHMIERAVLFSANSDVIDDSHIIYENESLGQNSDDGIAGPSVSGNGARTVEYRHRVPGRQR